VWPLSVSFFRKRWTGKGGRETLKIGEESLSGQRIPNSTGVLDQSFKNKRHCCARVLGFCRESGQGKVCREKLKIGEESLSGQRIPNSTGFLDQSFKNKRHCCARVLVLLPGKWAGKGGQGKVGRERWAGKHSS
jgi:hypothetical protein